MDKPPRAPLWLWLLLTGGPVLLFTAYFTLPLGTFGPHHPALSWTVFVLLLTATAGLLLRAILSIWIESRRGLPGLTILLLSIVTLLVFSTCYLALARSRATSAV